MVHKQQKDKKKKNPRVRPLDGLRYYKHKYITTLLERKREIMHQTEAATLRHPTKANVTKYVLANHFYQRAVNQTHRKKPNGTRTLLRG